MRRLSDGLDGGRRGLVVGLDDHVITERSSNHHFVLVFSRFLVRRTQNDTLHLYTTLAQTQTFAFESAFPADAPASSGRRQSVLEVQGYVSFASPPTRAHGAAGGRQDGLALTCPVPYPLCVPLFFACDMSDALKSWNLILRARGRGKRRLG